MRHTAAPFAALALVAGALGAQGLVSPGLPGGPAAANAAPAVQEASGLQPMVTLSSGSKIGAARTRVSGADRYGTSVAISQRAYPDPAKVSTVYLTSGTTTLEGLAGGALKDGPVLAVPTGCQGVPAVVQTEIARVNPQRVIALGDWRKVCSTQLTTAAAGRATARLDGPDQSARVAAIARRAYPAGARTVYLVGGQVSAEALVAGTLKDGPILATTLDGTGVASSTEAAIAALNPTTVVAIGGRSAVSDAALAEAGAGRATARIDGGDRYATAVAVAKRAFSWRTSRVYVAPADNLDEVQGAGMITDGPVVLVPATYRPVNSSTKAFLSSRTPGNVVAVGRTLSGSTLVGASNAARGPVDCSVTACVALTFDDGPGAPSPTVLDTLAAARVPATFFEIGSKVDTGYATTYRQHVEGNVVGNHTWTHPQMNLLSYTAQKAEVDRTATEIASHGVPRPKLLRPPYGAWNTATRQLGYPLILWDVDPEDWKSITSADVRSRVVSNTRAGSIVLMHDIHWRTSDALPGIISDLKARGYTMVTVPELTSLHAGDLVYRRGQQYAYGSGLGSQGATGPVVVDEAPVPGLAPQIDEQALLDSMGVGH